jgi:2-polyprenyl-6-methoxyphenol hydroxylase-like FAD-dependent oxidoreductase
VTGYDAVIVGGRCAGATLAISLAKSGASVLMLDRDELGSDTVSTHTFFPNTIVRLEELGVIERIRERHELHPVIQMVRILGRELSGTFTPIGGHDRAFAPRRPVLDRALGEAAIDAGADARFGIRVAGLLGSGTDDDRVRGVELEDGTRLEAPWVIGADGRASSVARALGLPKRNSMASDMSMLFAYWRGVPRKEFFSMEAIEGKGMNLIPCEDDVTLLVSLGPPEFTRGDADTRRRRYLDTLRAFPETLDPAALDTAEMVSEIVVVPETMLRGFFRPAAGPGWALVGDAGHFKHPATAQGISDAIEQALYVAEALNGSDQDLLGYEGWRDARAAGHYEFSFQFGSFPKPEKAGPIFDGIGADPAAEQDFRDVFCRTVNPRDVMNQQRLGRGFAPPTAR